VPESEHLYAQLLPSFSQLPPAFQRARNYHLGIHPLHVPQRLLQQLRAAARAGGGLLSAETYTAAESRPSLQQIKELAACADILSPNLLEAESVVGAGAPEELVDRLLDAGATTVALRMGPDGALVKHGPSGERWAAWQRSPGPLPVLPPLRACLSRSPALLPTPPAPQAAPTRLASTRLASAATTCRPAWRRPWWT
jgi:sugar/nucleoside kinase (ribokinase family)